MAMDFGRVCEKTVYNWKNYFCDNGFRFTESLIGKSIHEWILDNPIMNEQAKAWLQSKVGRRPKQGQAHFVVRDFQTYLSETLLKDWQVPKWKGATAAATNMVDDSDFLQVSESCALAWAHRLGLCYATRKKHYYVDGHDRPDVLAHHEKWLEKEGRLELRQYLPLGADAFGKGAKARGSSPIIKPVSKKTGFHVLGKRYG